MFIVDQQLLLLVHNMVNFNDHCHYKHKKEVHGDVHCLFDYSFRFHRAHYEQLYESLSSLSCVKAVLRQSFFGKRQTGVVPTQNTN